MFDHIHPYAPFNLKEATKLIVGTLPPPRFTTGELLPEDVDFCYGSKNGMLWPILDNIFDLNLVYENTAQAIDQRCHFLKRNKIGVCDIVASAKRNKIDASDLGMQEVVLRDLITYLRTHIQIDTLIFTGGNSKNGPEYFFRRQAKENQLKLDVVSSKVPRIHQFKLDGRTVKTVSLTAPSGAANRAIGSMKQYKDQKLKNPQFNTFDFRIQQYREFFEKS
ncbi:MULTISPECIES: uracil-DNA glycosylase family protein [Leeuwenhoekiella]|uniref:G/U mismatch-specific uracil-DNA glycosylase n=2 Tax=Leeuwenhoekiella TaxID=283735 RepID=A0A4Q0NSR0_9FLAO|nr:MULTISPECIES: uracil-DNA glycosylase family protein [Leeuwenhoekiella]RXG13926.1 G/U mismatch-specific uracil-DNA glycosylase [Leeuwenhoekiella aestuarii]RXG25281.1 G/U mismatch-specific uracil-DNA glycosylase [Leeuwenhoekiella polynyae]